jgi:hypothetical protein
MSRRTLNSWLIVVAVFLVVMVGTYLALTQLA